MIRLARVYNVEIAAGEYGVLVDRLWPRGLSKERAVFREWLTSVAPSHELRRWYAQRAEVFEEFAARYRLELTQSEAREGLTHLRELSRGRLVLLSAKSDLDHSHLVVLRDLLEDASTVANTT